MDYTLLWRKCSRHGWPPAKAGAAAPEATRRSNQSREGVADNHVCGTAVPEATKLSNPESDFVARQRLSSPLRPILEYSQTVPAWASEL